ncbi:MAG: hypothetical protein AABW79_00400 [Nanoarchaeota archaeon]
MKNSSNHFGSWAFLIGVILALALAVFNVSGGSWPLVMVIIGLIVGLLNINEHETHHFLMSGAILIIVSYLGMGAMETVPVFARTLGGLLMIFVPATIIVAIKNVFSLARH